MQFIRRNANFLDHFNVLCKVLLLYVLLNTDLKNVHSIKHQHKLEKFVLQATHQSAIARFYGGSWLAVPTRGDEVALLATNNVPCEPRRLIKIA